MRSRMLPASIFRWPLLALAVLMIAVTASPAPAHADQSASTEVTVPGSGGVDLAGTVITPADSTDEAPGIVMLPGAGNRPRASLLAEAKAFAGQGIATLIFDKRPDYSLFHRDYSVLAQDALAAVEVLRSQPGVDPKRIGIWALSEGGWVAPMVANASPNVHFIIAVGASGPAPAAQQAWSYGEYLDHAGVSGSLHHALESTATRLMAGAGLFAEHDHDGIPDWSRVDQPVLAEWGTLDREAVPFQSAEMISDALAANGNRDYEIRAVEGARHNLRISSDQGFDQPSDLPDDYAEYEAQWIRGLADGPHVNVDDMVATDHRSRPLSPLAWWESPWVQLGYAAVMLAFFAAIPLTAIARRLSGRRDRPKASRVYRLAVATGMITTLGLYGYLMFLMATSTRLIGVTPLGRPIPWLVLQLLAVLTVALAAAGAVAWWRRRSAMAVVDRVRTGLMVLAGVLFVPWSLYWGLLIP